MALGDQSTAFLAERLGSNPKALRAWIRLTISWQSWLLESQIPPLAATKFSVAFQFAEKCNCPQHRTPDLKLTIVTPNGVDQPRKA